MQGNKLLKEPLARLKQKKIRFSANQPLESDSTTSISGRVVKKEVITYDELGQVVSHSEAPVRSNGGGFVISYTAKMCEFLEKVSTGATVRVFLYLAHHQNYGVDGVYGFRCTRQHLTDKLALTRKTTYSALKFLIDNFLVNELKIGGTCEYMVNPDYVTIGSDKKTREREWSQRWEWYWKRKHQT